MAGRFAVKTEALEGATGGFDVCVWTPDVVSRVIVFGVGAGGDPGRHAPLLETLARQQCLVAAPAFERPRCMARCPLSMRLESSALALPLVAVVPLIAGAICGTRRTLRLGLGVDALGGPGAIAGVATRPHARRASAKTKLSASDGWQCVSFGSTCTRSSSKPLSKSSA
jgi:hypothetical protein